MNFLLGAGVVFFSLVCSVCAVEAEKLSFSRVSPRKIDVSKVTAFEFEFDLSKPATVVLRITDFDGQEVGKVESNVEAGKQKLTWDAKTAQPAVSDGAYFFSLEATLADGKKLAYAPAFDSALEKVKVLRPTLDIATGATSFLVPQIAMARVRVYRGDNMFVRGLAHWRPYLAGEVKLQWDRKDQSGLLTSEKDSSLYVSISAYSLPENTVIVEGTGKTKAPRSEEAQRAWRKHAAFEQKFFPVRIPREKWRDPELYIEPYSMDGSRVLPLPLQLDGPVLIRTHGKPQDATMLMDEGFELCVYIDGALVFEEEDGIFPFNFTLNPKGLNEGEHVLSIMAVSSEDHVGIVSQKFVFKKNPEAVPIEAKEKK